MRYEKVQRLTPSQRGKLTGILETVDKHLGYGSKYRLERDPESGCWKTNLYVNGDFDKGSFVYRCVKCRAVRVFLVGDTPMCLACGLGWKEEMEDVS